MRHSTLTQNYFYATGGWSLRDWDRVIWQNNPMCIAGWWQAILGNNPRGPMPNNNPSELEDLLSRLERETRTP